MDYLRASLKLTGRCKLSRKLRNNTYLIRRSDSKIAVRLHSTDVVTFHADGSIDLHDGGWCTITTKDRINCYFEGRVWTESGYWFTSFRGETVAGLGAVDSNGKLVGGSVDEQRQTIREERNERNRPRNRARYWMNKAREGKPFKGTVDDILAEENATVRVAKMRCYGMDRFFVDAKPDIVDEKAGYQLLAIPIDNWRKAKALKMACTTTGAVYINTVPEHCHTVPDALDWMFDTHDYLGQVTEQA